MQILAALGVLFPGGGVDLDLIEHLAGFGVDLATVEIGLHGKEIEKAALTTGEVGHQVKLGGLEDFGYQLAEIRRGEELPVLNLLFRLAVAVVAVKVLSLQPMQAAVPGVGIVDVLAGNAGLGRSAAVNQIEHLFIERPAANGISNPPDCF